MENPAYVPDHIDVDSDVIEKNNLVLKELKDKHVVKESKDKHPKQKGFFKKYFSWCCCKKCCKNSDDF